MACTLRCARQPPCAGFTLLGAVVQCLLALLLPAQEVGLLQVDGPLSVSLYMEALLTCYEGLHAKVSASGDLAPCLPAVREHPRPMRRCCCRDCRSGRSPVRGHLQRHALPVHQASEEGACLASRC